MSKVLKFVPACFLLGFLSLPQSIQACAVCFGKSDSKLAEGMNWGIMALLFVVTFVLACISGFFIYIAKRASTSSEKNSKT
jgi:heme/copper-type cytochrome/quinol oxidase subunit 2